MKKIISFLIISILSLGSLQNTFAENNFLTNDKKIENSRKSLQNLNGKKYLDLIDDFLEKNNSKETLEKLLEKSGELIKSGKIKDKTQANVINYLYVSVQVKLNNFEKDKKIKDFLNPSISEKDKKDAEARVLKIQNNLKNSLLEEVKDFSEILKKQLSSIDKGELKSSFKSNLYGTSSAFNLNLTDIESKNSVFDSEAKAKIDFNYSVKNGEFSDDVSVKSDLEAVQKDGDIYLLLKNLDFRKNPEVAELKEKVEKLKEVFSKNKFLKIDSKFGDEEIFFNNFIQKGDLNELSKSLKILSEKAFFEAYKKEGNRYFLRPSREFCETVYAEKCSEKLYKTFVESFAEESEIAMTISGENTVLDYRFGDDYSSLYGSINFSDKEIKKIEINGLFPSYSVDKVDSFSLSYARKSTLKIKAKNEFFKMDFDSKLDEKNNFSFINSDFSFFEARGFLKLENKKLSSEIKISKDNNITLNGTFDNNNKISDLTFTVLNNYFSGNLKLRDYKLVGNFKGKGFFMDFDFVLDRDFVPVSGKFDLTAGEFKTNFKGQSGNFYGKTFFDGLVVNHNWKISKNNFSVNDDFEVKKENVKGSLKSDIYIKDNYSKVSFDLKINENKNSIDFYMDFKNSRIFSENIEIKAPKNFIKSSEVFPELNYNYYDNYSFDDLDYDYDFVEVEDKANFGFEEKVHNNPNDSFVIPKPYDKKNI